MFRYILLYLFKKIEVSFLSGMTFFLDKSAPYDCSSLTLIALMSDVSRFFRSTLTAKWRRKLLSGWCQKVDTWVNLQ